MLTARAADRGYLAQQTLLPAQSPSANVDEVSCPSVTVCFTLGEDYMARIVKVLGEAHLVVFWYRRIPYTSAHIAKALVDAQKRSVWVEAILDRSNRTDKNSVADFLPKAGIPTLIDAQHAIAHNKIIVIDGEIVIGGSFNYTKAAQGKNAEKVEITRDKGLASRYAENWQTHGRHSEPYIGREVAR
jgi:phosphatidylserine/phosphatidylglycerophosphate/cardiolipin synthase-like enzyme